MADSHPFANAGLGMFGTAEKSYAGQAMHAPGGRSVLQLLAGMLYQPNTTPYSLQNNMGGTTAMGQGVAPPTSMVPSGVGLNPMRPAGLSVRSSMGMPGKTTVPPVVTLPDLNKQIDSYWGAQ